MLARSRFFASGPIVLSRPQKWDCYIEATAVFLRASSSGGGAVRASCDPLDPGRFLFLANFYVGLSFPQVQVP